MTYITELAQSLKRRAASANEFGESLYVKADDVIALVEALEKAQQHIARQEQIILNQDESLSIRRGELEKAQTVNAAAEKLIRCKGRYHSEQNYRALAALFGVNAPDLPPLDGESRTVKLPELCVGVVQGGHAVMVPYAAGHWFNKTAILEMLTAAGIKWEAE